VTTETDLVQQLVAAQRASSRSVDQDAFAAVDRAAAYRIQIATMQALGMTPAMFKAAVAPDGSGAIAPIFAGRVGDSGKLKLSAASVTGLEVEVGVVLSRDLPPGSDRAAVEAAIGRYFAGVEICGTRFLDRPKATYDGGLADMMSAFGYVIDPGDWEHGVDLTGIDIDLEFNGTTIYGAPAKAPFGGVLESVVAYAALKSQPYPLAAGTILTTGSMCGLVPTTGPGKAVARLGGHTVEVELT
jgi:2-keto-4-pentenoate hydratase